MKKYNSTNLYKLIFEIAEKSASSPDKVTSNHLLYAYSVLLTMPENEVLEEVGGDENRNIRVRAALMDALIHQDKSRTITLDKENLKAIKQVTSAYIPLIESSEKIEYINECYSTFLETVKNILIDENELSDKFTDEVDEFSYFYSLLYYSIAIQIAGEELKSDDSYKQEALEYVLFINYRIVNPILKTPHPYIKTPDSENWQKPDEAKLAANLLKKLEETVCGQSLAVKSFVDAYKKATLFVKTDEKPLATFLLAGPPGVGKTLLAETAAKVLGRPYKRFDMSEYSSGSSDMASGLVGFEKTWKSAVPGVLTGFVEDNPNAVILFDEIEKAGKPVLMIFLQILNDGRLTDKYTERTSSFKNTILIFTTNAGKELYLDNYEKNLSLIPSDTVVSALQQDSSFPNELVSRFASNNIIMFNHISKMNLMDIALNSMKSAKQNLNREIILDDGEKLAQLLLLHEGSKGDARIVSSKAKDFVLQAMLDYMDYEAENGIHEDFPIHIGISNEADRYLAQGKNNPIKIEELKVLYVTDTNPERSKFKIDICSRIDDERFENCYSYPLIVVDPSCGTAKTKDEMQKKVLDRNSEGNRMLQKILDYPGRSHIYVADNGELDSEEMRYLFQRGVEGILPKSPRDKEWGRIIARLHTVRSLEKLDNDGKKLDYRLVCGVDRNSNGAIICGRITLQNLSLRNAVVYDSKTRQNDKGFLLSDFERPKERFSDVIGHDNAKRELMQFIKYVKNQDYYDRSGLKTPRGLLLYGPPGTGKTMLARAAAGEGETISFIAVAGSDFEKMYSGEGEQKIRDLFAAARRHKPAIIFIDEIDSIGKQRSGASTDKLTNTLLTEMDGFEKSNRQVFVIAATNMGVEGNSANIIDGALARRFKTHIYVGLPSRSERVQFVQLYLKNMSEQYSLIDKDQIDRMAESLADQTIGKSNADVENMLEFSLRRFAMSDERKTSKQRFNEKLLLEYVQEMRFGEVKHDPVVSTAYHEAAHAVISWLVGQTPAFLTIVSRGNFGGYVQLKESDLTCDTEKSLRNRIKISLAGRAGEIIYYKYYAEDCGNPELLNEAYNTGANSDLEHATYYAKLIVSMLGRNNNLARISEDSQSAEMKREVLEEINLLLKVEMERTLKIAEENSDLIHELALEALDKTQLSSKQITDKIEKTIAKRNTKRQQGRERKSVAQSKKASSNKK